MTVLNGSMTIGNGQDLRMTTMEIAEYTGKEHRNVKRDTEVMLLELYGNDSLLSFEQSYIADNGQTYSCYSLPHDEILNLISGYSATLRQKIIKRLSALEKERLGNSQDIGMNTAEVECNMIALKYTIENLKPSPVSVIQMTKILYLDLGLKTNLLPEYVENARVTFSLTDLITKTQGKVKTQAFNKLLLAAGYLEEKERPSKSKGVKKFKALTEKGLQFGTNDISPSNPREVQPHYFEDTFSGLYSELTSH